MSRTATVLKRTLATVSSSVAESASSTARVTTNANATLSPVLQQLVNSQSPTTEWALSDLRSVHQSPILDLLYAAQQVHRQHHAPNLVQQCTLLSIKTGGCSENCAYCPQSSRYNTFVKSSPLLKQDVVMEAAREAKQRGSTRFCMGAAWRDLKGRRTNVKNIAEYVRQIRSETGMEVCCTLGMIDEEQAKQLKDSGLTAYNHNLDTSREFYSKVITSRSYEERLETLRVIRDSGISICSGGIIGMGESIEDRLKMLQELAVFQPESVPINCLVAVKGTPLENLDPVNVWELVRMVATARIMMPKSMVRLSAGRLRFSYAEQALCFMAGANSIFVGDKLLTTANNNKDQDAEMFEILGLQGREPRPEVETTTSG